MALTPIQDIRNIAFCGHGSAGKTMLIDKILTSTGTIKRAASVDDGTSVCDFDEEEKQHKYTIESSLVHLRHEGKLFNILDTPGYPDFIGQTLRRCTPWKRPPSSSTPTAVWASILAACFKKPAGWGWGGSSSSASSIAKTSTLPD